jgi:hypothetical protein
MTFGAHLFRQRIRVPALSVRRVLTRLAAAATRLDRLAQHRAIAPLMRLDGAAAARSLVLLSVLRLLLRRAIALPAERAAEAVADWLLPPSACTEGGRTTTDRVRRWVVRPTRELALASGLVLLVAVVAVGLTSPAPQPPEVAVQAAVETQDRPGRWNLPGVDANAAPVEGRPTPPDLRPPTTPPAAPPASAAPAPAVEAPAPAAPETPPAPAERWLPTGTGMWLHDWVRSEGGNAAGVVARSQASGFSHLFVQTGSTKKGWIGDEVLGQLMPATVGTDIKVIAWDFPKLIDPAEDARRMAYAAWWSAPGAPRVAAVAPDVETAAEGTRLTPHAVLEYYRELRRLLPPDIAVLATVPYPSERRIGSYPYHETAAHSDAWIPMTYWYNRSPKDVTAWSMDWLSQFGKPVMPVGQGYDGRIDAPYLAEDPDPAGSVQAFVDAARIGRAQSISLWSWQTTGLPQWEVLWRASALPWPPAY